MNQRLKIALIVTLVLLNAGLLYLVTRKMDESQVSTGTITAPPTGPAPSPTETETPAAEPGGRPGLVVAGDDTIFRIDSGSCDGKDGPALTVSSDSGAAFDDVGLPDEVRSIFSLTASNADDLDLIAASDDCVPLRYVSTDGGDVWEAAEGADVWFLDLRKKVTSPRGEVDPECTETLVLAAVSDRSAHVFCASGVLVGTDDEGQTWSRLGFLDGVKAAGFATKRAGYALAPDGGCATGSYATEDAGRSWTAIGCLDAGPGRAMAANRNLVAAIAGDAVYVSEDGGRNWSKAS